MTQEEKAKAYDEALSRARVFRQRWQGIGAIDSELALKELKEIFPELKESEDERIRKSLIKSYTNQHPSNFPTVDGFTREQILAWLEKQGEQKPYNYESVKPQFSTPMSYGKELEKRMYEACNNFFAPNTDPNRYSASDLFYAGVKAERDLCMSSWSEEDEKILNLIIRDYEAALKSFSGYQGKLDWLKSLKERIKGE